MKTKTNAYNIYDEQNSSTILYHAVAWDVNHVAKLAMDNGIDIEGMTIELERLNVKTQMGYPIEPYIEPCAL